MRCEELAERSSGERLASSAQTDKKEWNDKYCELYDTKPVRAVVTTHAEMDHWALPSAQTTTPSDRNSEDLSSVEMKRPNSSWTIPK